MTVPHADAVISWISGPVLRARTAAPFRVHEAVRAGSVGLLGEVIHLTHEEITVQVYDETSGLRPGDPVNGTGAPLSVELGPWLLGHMFDGLLRPLAAWDEFIEPGAPTTEHGRYSFQPSVAVGDHVEGGSEIGVITLGPDRTQRCMLHPAVSGRVTSIVDAGTYAADDVVCTVSRDTNDAVEVTMGQRWPLRHPRPARTRRPPSEPMLTGQRILDTLFPVARGGRAALPGGFGTGKTVLQQALAKFADADVVVYVGCGERGNEITEVLEEFPELEDPRTGRPLLERTVVIANTSNMPVAAREASIYTGVTVAEYFRDQGLHVALMADSTSRWAEALREVSGRLGELPAESGYPAYLSSRLAEFYERAGSVTTLAGSTGSLTIIAAVSPPGGDFSEPVTKHSQRYVRCMWTLDPVRAHARLYPAIHPLTSYSEDVTTLAAWWESGFNPRWSEQRRKLLVLLEQQAQLERMARIVGKDAMPQRQRLVLLCAELATDAFLSQSALSPVDARCSPARQTAMLRLITRFTSRAQAALDRDVRIERIAALPIVRRLQRMGEDIGEDRLEAFETLAKDMENAFAGLDGRSDDEG